MADDSSISDDPGTILDTFDDVLKALPEPPPAVSPGRRRAPVAEEVLYRSPYRWTAPRLLICNDNSLDEGEMVHIRSDVLTIGRTKGDVVIGHDVAMSGEHAEIKRRDSGGRHAWVLRDRGSSNGTLARAVAVTLTPGTTVLLGSKRYRFEYFGGLQLGAENGENPGTRLLEDLSRTPVADLPALAEVGVPVDRAATRFLFRKTRLTIGRPGFGNDIEIDDLCLAGIHAVVTRDFSGVWQLEAKPSLNGVWVKVDQIKLINNCFFQCGEQRFRFWL
jgi:pSer/pThr/pTyr-binding forkhead associated (FHA) protein